MLEPKILDSGLKFAGPFQKRARTDFIVLHHAAASQCMVEDVHRWHLNNGWLGIGYHYFIRKDGGIWRGRPEEATGAHCVGYNDCSIGICAEGDFTLEQMPDSQKMAITVLAKWLKSKYPDAAIKKHSDLNATACPGKNYPFDAIVAEVLPIWDPAAEIRALRAKGLINSDHDPSAHVTWGELATVLNRIAK